MLQQAIVPATISHLSDFIHLSTSGRALDEPGALRHVTHGL